MAGHDTKSDVGHSRLITSYDTHVGNVGFFAEGLVDSPILTDAIVDVSADEAVSSYETPQVSIASRESSGVDKNGSVQPYRESSSNDPS